MCKPKKMSAGTVFWAEAHRKAAGSYIKVTNTPQVKGESDVSVGLALCFSFQK